MQRLAGPFGKALHFPTGLEAVDKAYRKRVISRNRAAIVRHGGNSARLWTNFPSRGLTDSRHSEHPWQGYHIDNATNSALPPHPDWQRYGYILSAIFLHDIEGVVRRCSSAQVHRINWIKLGEVSGRAGGMGIPDLREFKGELADPVPLTAKRVVLHPLQLFGSRRTAVSEQE